MDCVFKTSSFALASLLVNLGSITVLLEEFFLVGDFFYDFFTVSPDFFDFMDPSELFLDRASD